MLKPKKGNMWCITNKIGKTAKRNISYFTFKGFCFYTDGDIGNKLKDPDLWYSTGHILLRTSCYIKDRGNNKNLFKDLYEKYSDSFIRYLKGNFIIIHIRNNEFNIYSDPFAVNKFFYYQCENDFCLSNDLHELAKYVRLEPSDANMAIYALTLHFTGGLTAFKGIYHNQPGQIISYNDARINVEYYFRPNELLKVQQRDITIKQLSDELLNTISSCLKISDGRLISLSLTGGADTRNLLAVFLKLGITPHLYTYGNPQSDDVVKAENISKSLNLPHSVYDIKIDEPTFVKYGRKIVKANGGLSSIHRVHRFLAVLTEANYANTMFLGTLGGEFVKGVSEDNYIITSVLYENWHSNFSKEMLLNYFIQKRLKTSNTKVLEDVAQFFYDQPFSSGSIKERKHSALCDITAHLHDAQDVNLYETVMDHVFTPFLDLDYLELLFSSPYIYHLKDSISNSILRRINYPLFSSRFLNETYKPLLDFRYCREHRPKDVLLNKYYAALARFLRQKMQKRYPPNFALGKWMFDFVSDNLTPCKDFKVINDTFDIDALQSDLKNDEHLMTESYWLKFTNPIMMRFIIEEFSN